MYIIRGAARSDAEDENRGAFVNIGRFRLPVADLRGADELIGLQDIRRDRQQRIPVAFLQKIFEKFQVAVRRFDKDLRLALGLRRFSKCRIARPRSGCLTGR